ncbi:MAG: phosphatidylserine/phosphatidylglycerophosphate/cardiolipin synthase family protein [Planctomycetes bacterium]|nr:phosphatidylserine/phosphatidylglycerophosphate/cardiolipin synthase family protein [Planctomycetota bacterium]
MSQPNTRTNPWGGARLASAGAPTRLALWLLLPSVLAGCQVPPAQPETGATGHGNCCRGIVLTQQLVADSAVQTATMPLATGAQAACDAGAVVLRAGQELVCKRLVLPLAGPPGPLDPDRTCRDSDRRGCHAFAAKAWRSSKRDLQAALVQIDVDGGAALRTLEGLIASAQQCIDVLMYQWDSDALGWAVAQRLATRAACLGAAPDGGPSVRILVDGGGTLIHSPPELKSAAEANEVLGWLIRQPHIQVLRTRNGLGHFDHRKLVVVDDGVAWSGGRNFTLASFFEYHDLSYVLHGPLVGDLADCFEKAWEEAGGRPAGPVSPGPALEGANAWASVVGTGRCSCELSRAIYQAVDHAWHHVYLENPYLTDTLLICKLVRARRRGADVRVILAEDSQSRLIDGAARVTANRLLRAGIRVYTYPGTTHVKAASVDGRWGYVGTGNFDSLSLRRNNEIGLAIAAGPFIGELEQRLFLADFQPEWEVTAPLPVSACDYLAEMVATLIL